MKLQWIRRGQLFNRRPKMYVLHYSMRVIFEINPYFSKFWKFSEQFQYSQPTCEGINPSYRHFKNSYFEYCIFAEPCKKSVVWHCWKSKFGTQNRFLTNMILFFFEKNVPPYFSFFSIKSTYSTIFLTLFMHIESAVLTKKRGDCVR